ncbi:MAG: HlyD family efflux transporter periplasmic adaptor subunit [Pirellulaceae bacterium]|nr:HlyD family efflux transporter periplasmic adaptor subunit [Pirellulaceae bacterium]
MANYLKYYRRTSRIALAFSLLVAFGCKPVPMPGVLVSTLTEARSTFKSREVSAQGRLLPASGIIQVSALPGDRIDEVLVKVGQHVLQGQVLVKMRSEKLRTLELEAARVKLDETRKAAQVKRTESQLNIDSAQLRLKQAESQRRQAIEQKKLVDAQSANSPTSQIATLTKQIDSLVALRQDPLTRPMIGAMELEARQNELSKVDTSLRSSLLTAVQSNEAADLAVELARANLAAAEKAANLVDESFPTQSLEKQIELLELQVAQSLVVAPSSSVILSLLAEAGELSSGLPMIELANLDRMICIAEVHEADVGQLQIGNHATIQSSALDRPLRGRISRIDSLVGLPQMRSPNPMARTDFRAMPIVIEFDDDDSRLASYRVQMQVDVLIQTDRPAD